jgi:hypothetical protein
MNEEQAKKWAKAQSIRSRLLSDKGLTEHTPLAAAEMDLERKVLENEATGELQYTALYY